LINVDIYVPSLDRVYNFNLDENSKVSVLIEEISELIYKKEHSSLEGEISRFLMGSIDKKTNFSPSYTLKEYSVKTGDKLILL